MNAKTKRARAERRVRVDLDEFGFELGETLNQRLTRLDAELAAQRVDCGTRGEPSIASETLPVPPSESEQKMKQLGRGIDPTSEMCYAAFDSLAAAQAFTYSSVSGVPYSELRKVTRLSEVEKAELSHLINKIRVKYPAHTELIDFGLALTAVQGGALDSWLCAVASGWPPDEGKSRLGVDFDLSCLFRTSLAVSSACRAHTL